MRPTACAELLLEQRDLVRDGGLREVAQPRGPREVAQFGDGDEGPQLPQFHQRILSIRFNHFIGRMMTSSRNLRAGGNPWP